MDLVTFLKLPRNDASSGGRIQSDCEIENIFIILIECVCYGGALVDDLSDCLLSPQVQRYTKSGSISPNYLLLESSKVQTNIPFPISLPVTIESWSTGTFVSEMIRTQSIIFGIFVSLSRSKNRYIIISPTYQKKKEKILRKIKSLARARLEPVIPDFVVQWFVHRAAKFVLKRDRSCLINTLVRNDNSLIPLGGAKRRF